MWELICLILLLPILILTMVIIFKARKRRILANRIPGPDGSFLIGSLPLFLHGSKKMITNLKSIYRMYEQSTFKIWVLNYLYIFITQPEDIEFVLNNPKLQLKAREYEVVRESILGQGILSIDDLAKWNKNRKIVTEGFRFSSIKSFIPTFYDETIFLNELLHKKADLNSKECEISIPIIRASMEIIGITAFGVKFNAQSDKSHRFTENFHIVLTVCEYRLTHPWYMNNTIFKCSSIGRKHAKSKKIIAEFIDELIKEKLAEIKQTANDKKKIVTDDENVYRKPKTVIEILLEHHNEMSHEQIRDELVTIMAAGQDTSSVAMACAIFMLAHHQDVFEELESIFLIGDYERMPTYDDLAHMVYLERVIKETLRLFPPGQFFGRKLGEDMQIGKYLCPAGSTLLMFPVSLHTSPLYYTDPLKFNPDNFLPEACKNRHPYAFIPFSGGSRNCIGIKYAMIQMKTLISTLVRKNKFYPSDKCPSPDHLRQMILITLKFANKCYVKIERRT